jgi:hypothetical protein
VQSTATLSFFSQNSIVVNFVITDVANGPLSENPILYKGTVERNASAATGSRRRNGLAVQLGLRDETL